MNKHLFLEQLYSLVVDETNLIANLANTSAFLNTALENINWVGFYLVDKNELVLGPFQGKVACIRIPLGRGVCGTAALNGEVIRVEDVHQFCGHIACDSASNSEIVLPIMKDGHVVAVLDIDSPIYNRFTMKDERLLRNVVDVLEKYVFEKVTI